MEELSPIKELLPDLIALRNSFLDADRFDAKNAVLLSHVIAHLSSRKNLFAQLLQAAKSALDEADRMWSGNEFKVRWQTSYKRQEIVGVIAKAEGA